MIRVGEQLLEAGVNARVVTVNEVMDGHSVLDLECLDRRPRPLIEGRARLLIPVAAGVISRGVAIAVIALRWHFFTDTIGGAAVGTGTVCALALVLDLPTVSRWLERNADNRTLCDRQSRPATIAVALSPGDGVPVGEGRHVARGREYTE